MFATPQVHAHLHNHHKRLEFKIALDQLTSALLRTSHDAAGSILGPSTTTLLDAAREASALVTFQANP
jgi:hypothetical protein